MSTLLKICLPLFVCMAATSQAETIVIAEDDTAFSAMLCARVMQQQTLLL